MAFMTRLTAIPLVVAIAAATAAATAVAHAAHPAAVPLPSPALAPPSLADALTAALRPVLLNLSAHHRNGSSVWSVAYRDATTQVQVCAGAFPAPSPSALSSLATYRRTAQSLVPCNATTDQMAFGSTTKPMTATLVLQLVEQGVLALEDLLVDRADAFLRTISGGNTTLSLLFPDTRRLGMLTLRHLLQMQSGIADYDGYAVRAYQNDHRGEDLGPDWVLWSANRTFLCDPGTCGKYSSTNYVLLGLVLGQALNLTRWDALDQRMWIRGNPDLQGVDFGVHGPCGNLTGAEGLRGGTIAGYQPVCRPGRHGACVPLANHSDVRSMSSTQGWTCGNLITTLPQVANYFWHLLGPPQSVLNATTMRSAMLNFSQCEYFGSGAGNCTENGGTGTQIFGYGLGIMNFTSMNWGLEHEGQYYGHNGLTYGFGAQSGFNYDLGFSMSMANNVEYWIGPEAVVPNPTQVYTVMCAVVRAHRARQQQQKQQQQQRQQQQW